MEFWQNVKPSFVFGFIAQWCELIIYYVDLGRSKLCLCWQRSKGKAKAFGISIGDSNVECGRNVYFLVRILLMNIFEYIWGHLRQLSWYRKFNMKYMHHSLKDLHYMFNVEIIKMQVFKNIVAVKLMGLNFTNENFVICSTFWTN